MLFFKTTGPVSHKPDGINTTPPPFLLNASIAPLILFVFNVLPSETAPYFLMLSVSFLKTGDFITGSFSFCANAKRNAIVNNFNRITFFIWQYQALLRVQS